MGEIVNGNFWWILENGVQLISALYQSPNFQLLLYPVSVVKPKRNELLEWITKQIAAVCLRAKTSATKSRSILFFILSGRESDATKIFVQLRKVKKQKT